MHFVSWDEVVARFRGKSVAIVGGAPSALDNPFGFVDSHDVVVRVNNYKTGANQGFRCDVHFSFYGGSIRKTVDELKRDGVSLLMCKCPDSKPLSCDWHERNNKQNGIDFRYIYKARRDWWPVDTYVPTDAHFLRTFELLDGHIPTTGFTAIFDALLCEPRSLFLSGFDGFSSGIHHGEKWKPGDPTDPIGHRPEMELAWIAANVNKYPIACDAKLTQMIQRHRAAA